MSEIPAKRARTDEKECRACLTKLNDDSGFVEIFRAWDPAWSGMGLSIAEDLAKLTNIEINVSEQLSNIICTKCCCRLQDAIMFTMDVQTNDRVLRDRHKDSVDENPLWPKPIQVDKNITSNALNEMTVEVKQEVLTEDEYESNEPYNEDVEPNLDIKIEPEEITPAIPSGPYSLQTDQLEAEENGVTTFLDENSLEEVKDEPMSEDDAEPSSDMPKDCMLCFKTFHTVKGLKTQAACNADRPMQSALSYNERPHCRCSTKSNKMPRNGKRRKSTKVFHGAEVMRQAIMLIYNGMSIRAAAKHKGIPYATLARYYRKSVKAGTHDINLTPNYRVNQIFTDEQETSLADHIIKCTQMFYGLKRRDILSLAYEMALSSDVSVPSKWHQLQLAGKDWLHSFQKRQSIRYSLSRATLFNRHNVNTFYDNLHEAMSRNPRFGDGTRLYYLDETSTMNFQSSGEMDPLRNQVSKLTSAEEECVITTCFIVSAVGYALPPVTVFPRVHFNTDMTDTPAGTLELRTTTGIMDTVSFALTMQHFIDQTQSSKDNPSLLIIDNHDAHISFKALNLAEENGVTILTVPPHSTGKLEPLAVEVFGSFKEAYNRMMQNPGQAFTMNDVAECLKKAHMIVMTPARIRKGFATTGIFPYDRHIFTDIDFVASEITARPINEGPNQETIEDRSLTP